MTQMPNIPASTSPSSNTNNNLELKKTVSQMLRYWYLPIIFLICSLSFAFFYLRYTPPIFKASAKIMIDEGTGGVGESFLVKEFAKSFESGKKLSNEVLIMKSSLVMNDVVEKLGVHHKYYSVGRFLNTALYKNSPIEVGLWLPNNPDASFSATIFNIERGGYNIYADGDTFQSQFGKSLNLPSGVINIIVSPGSSPKGTYLIQLNSLRSEAQHLSSKLSVIPGERGTSSVDISIKEDHPEKAADIVNEFIDAYNRHNQLHRDKVLERTLLFIKERIGLLNMEIAEVQGKAEEFKAKNMIYDVTQEGGILMSQLVESRKQLEETNLQLEILNTIETFLKQNRENFDFVPTNVSLNNMTLGTMVSRFNSLLDERANQGAILGANHPVLNQMDKQLANLRESIIQNILSIRKDLMIQRRFAAENSGSTKSRMQTLPVIERDLMEIEREKTVKEGLYLFLLQKREEAAISMSVEDTPAKTLDRASPSHKPASPNKTIIWGISAVGALALGFGLAYLFVILNDKVEAESDITAMTSTPICGMIAEAKKNQNILVSEKMRSPIAEMFRLLRTNIVYISSGKNMQTLLVTSSTSGEGKSFTAINLGITYANTGKKVIILELDLRKPKQEKYFNIADRDKIGVSGFIVDDNISSNEIITQTEAHKNLYLISSGPKPPNPGELMLSSRLRSLVEELKAKYDLIIFDCAPVGLVADALQLYDITDATMYVARYGFTKKPQLNIIEDIRKNNKLPRPFIVFNGIPSKAQSAYGYGGGYSYGYGEYESD
jgi:capsular exopolysaccharide synthesis family protein